MKIALTVALLALGSSIVPAENPSTTRIPRRDCVGCDACNGAGGNHQTFANGGREGVKHECFSGSTCLVHDFNSNCGGTETEVVGTNEPTHYAWDEIEQLNDERLAEFLNRFEGRWELAQDSSRSLLLRDCIGATVARLPLKSEQLSVAEAVLANQH